MHKRSTSQIKGTQEMRRKYTSHQSRREEEIEREKKKDKKGKVTKARGGRKRTL